MWPQRRGQPVWLNSSLRLLAWGLSRDPDAAPSPSPALLFLGVLMCLTALLSWLLLTWAFLGPFPLVYLRFGCAFLLQPILWRVTPYSSSAPFHLCGGFSLALALKDLQLPPWLLASQYTWVQLAAVADFSLSSPVPGPGTHNSRFSRVSFSSDSPTTRIQSSWIQTQSFQKALSSAACLWTDIRITLSLFHPKNAVLKQIMFSFSPNDKFY